MNNARLQSIRKSIIKSISRKALLHCFTAQALNAAENGKRKGPTLQQAKRYAAACHKSLRVQVRKAADHELGTLLRELNRRIDLNGSDFMNARAF